MWESAELKVVASGEWKTLLLLFRIKFFYTKCTITMKMKSKFFKKIASCSLESNKIKIKQQLQW